MKTLILNPIASIFLGLNTLIMFATSFFFATYVPFLVDKGMNLLEVNIINSFYMIVVIIAEIPTGSFADKKGRHRSLSLSCFLLSLSAFVYYLAESFLFFILAEVIGAIGHTFASGAVEAWLVDSLKERKEEELQNKLFRLLPTFTTLGIIGGVLTGSYLGKYNLDWPWIASSIILFIIACASLFMKENYRSSNPFIKQATYKQELILALNQSRHDHNLIFIMTFGACLAFAIQALNMQWTIILKDEFEFNSFLLGQIFVGVSICLALGARFSKVVQTKLSEKTAIIVPQLLTALSIIICSQIKEVSFFITFFMLHEFGRGINKPLHQHFINSRLNTANRATILSVDSMFSKLGALMGLIISGILAQKTSIRVTWLFSGLGLMSALLIFLYKYHQPRPS